MIVRSGSSLTSVAGHFARDCPTKEAMVCRNCNEEGHMSKECPNPRDPATMKCRNCDEMGHSSRECPKKRDYSRVQCRNCSECTFSVDFGLV